MVTLPTHDAAEYLGIIVSGQVSGVIVGIGVVFGYFFGALDVVVV